MYVCITIHFVICTHVYSFATWSIHKGNTTLTLMLNHTCCQNWHTQKVMNSWSLKTRNATSVKKGSWVSTFHVFVSAVCTWKKSDSTLFLGRSQWIKPTKCLSLPKTARCPDEQTNTAAELSTSNAKESPYSPLRQNVMPQQHCVKVYSCQAVQTESHGLFIHAL